ncbi:hypothetical protein ACFQZ4_27475 [Catellatospora coxensis]
MRLFVAVFPPPGAVGHLAAVVDSSRSAGHARGSRPPSGGI